MVTRHTNHTTATTRKDGWKDCGHRGNNANAILTNEDIELTLSYTLLAHERMLAALRQGLSQLHDAQEGLGRRLEVVWTMIATSGHPELHYQNCTHHHHHHDSQPPPTTTNAQDCLELYRALAQELYRKQVLGQTLLDSATDEQVLALLELANNTTNDDNTNRSRTVFTRISAVRSSSEHGKPLNDNNDDEPLHAARAQAIPHQWKRTHSSCPLLPFQPLIAHLKAKFFQS